MVNDLVVFDPDRLKIVDSFPVEGFNLKNHETVSAPPDYFELADHLDKYFLTRTVQWRYRLDQYEDTTIREMLKTVRSTVAEIKRGIFDGDVPGNADAPICALGVPFAGLR